jgi:hypothetical protein
VNTWREKLLLKARSIMSISQRSREVFLLLALLSSNSICVHGQIWLEGLNLNGPPILGDVNAAFLAGEFIFRNPTALTHIGSAQGPLAGQGIWAQALAGPTPDSLAPVGVAREHLTLGTNTGQVVGGTIMVPTVSCATIGYVQMVAWDGGFWGTALAGVPPDQLGRTDTVAVQMACLSQPRPIPLFTQSAIVPIPEPSVVMLLAVGGAILLWGCAFAPASQVRSRSRDACSTPPRE